MQILLNERLNYLTGKNVFLIVKKQVSVFNEIIMNFFENFIPHETITCNDKDPPWMNKQIKEVLYKINSCKFYKFLFKPPWTN